MGDELPLAAYPPSLGPLQAADQHGHLVERRELAPSHVEGFSRLGLADFPGIGFPELIEMAGNLFL